MTDQLDGQMSLFDLDIWSSKMCQDSSQATEEKTSRESSQKSSKLSKKMLPMFLYLIGGGGEKRDALWVTEQPDSRFPSLGEYTMHSFGESPREENESRLSQILTDSVPQKYYLSARACLGILRRADKKDKELPEVLRQALERQAADEVREP